MQPKIVLNKKMFDLIVPAPDDPLKKLHIGDEELLKAIYRIKPKLYIGGHIHEGHGRIAKNNIIFINAAIMEGIYNPTNQSITTYL